MSTELTHVMDKYALELILVGIGVPTNVETITCSVTLVGVKKIVLKNVFVYNELGNFSFLISAS